MFAAQQGLLQLDSSERNQRRERWESNSKSLFAFLDMIILRDFMKVEIPDEFFKIANLLRTQDNRCTDQPIFIVQQKRRITGLNTDYTDNIVWLDAEGDYTEPDDDKLVELEEKYDESGEILEGWIRTGYMDEWEFVTACFTEQGCVDYLAANGHNIKEPRIYADGSYRNREFRLIHNWLLSLSELETVA